jgi:hypothetical protein
MSAAVPEHERTGGHDPRSLARMATRAEHNASDVDFDSPLMRLAAGGKLDRAEPEAA